MDLILLSLLLTGLGCCANAVTNSDKASTSGIDENKDTEAVCGSARRVDSLTSDGTLVPLGQFPWHAGVFVRPYDQWKVYDRWELNCGGSLITDRVVITTSFCVERRRFEMIRVAFAKFNQEFDKNEPFTVWRNVSNVTVPLVTEEGSWSQGVGDRWNIALVLMSSSVEFNDYVMPVCRPTHDAIFHHLTTARVVTWNGLNKTLGQREVAIYDCAVKERPKSEQICGASLNSTYPLAHTGDGGGSLTVSAGGKHYLIGFVSLKPLYTDLIVFTNVTYPIHEQWLDRKMDEFKDGGRWLS